MAANTSCKDYLQLSKIFDLGTWTRMTRDLFHNLDHPLFDVRASFVTFLTIGKRSYRRGAQDGPFLSAWCSCNSPPRCALQSTWWNSGTGTTVSKDALETLRYSIYDFLGPIALLLRNYYNAKGDKKYTCSVKVGASAPLETFGQVGTGFSTS
jgi:hypothetical protein